MKYIAVKPVRFDKNYAVGDEIPESAIDVRRVKQLIDLGLIMRLETSSEPPITDTNTSIDEPTKDDDASSKANKKPAKKG